MCVGPSAPGVTARIAQALRSWSLLKRSVATMASRALPKTEIDPRSSPMETLGRWLTHGKSEMVRNVVLVAGPNARLRGACWGTMRSSRFTSETCWHPAGCDLVWRIPRKQARHLPSCSHVLAWDAHRELYTNLGPQLETCGRSGGQWWKCPKARSTNCRATATVAKDFIQLWVGGWRQLLANHWWQIASLWRQE